MVIVSMLSSASLGRMTRRSIRPGGLVAPVRGREACAPLAPWSRLDIHRESQIGPPCFMDLLVNLNSRRMAELATRIAAVEATIRVALPPELHIVQAWVRRNFSEYWVSEVTVAMSHQPPGCLIAVDAGELVGFACYDATARGFFGPTGVAQASRGKGIGLALLFRTLQAMKAQGYGYAIIGSAGPHEFYASAVGAVPIEADREDIYQGLLRVPATPTSGP
jgi:predicted N-acetyltransferase YhbS